MKWHYWSLVFVVVLGLTRVGFPLATEVAARPAMADGATVAATQLALLTHQPNPTLKYGDCIRIARRAGGDCIR